MATVNIRRQGGAAIMTIPAEVMKTLGVGVGAEMEVSVVDGALSARPRTERPKRKRYTLDQLLAGATQKTMRALADETKWAREGAPVGREI